ncbi:hypothetical protein TNIN_110101 [Trichonephila inaurata madagascariensis]|uniref:Uncharacterized protein n=1 Tax=Trichonephila inaurata madagascariensis TaxID=2747483 RepID=A0A8X6XL72_9ARAC|nr:hypothetical protein TNIN_110101 [Trichonephila inaurata madagascariensis]
MKFRTILNSLKPSEVIQLGNVYAMDIIDLLVQVYLTTKPHDVPWFECFPISNLPTCTVIHGARGRQGKGAFTQPLWTEYAKPKLYGLV